VAVKFGFELLELRVVLNIEVIALPVDLGKLLQLFVLLLNQFPNVNRIKTLDLLVDITIKFSKGGDMLGQMLFISL
jgi:hypothetical protein